MIRTETDEVKIDLEGEFREFLSEVEQLVANSAGAELKCGISTMFIPAADRTGFDIKLTFDRDLIKMMFDEVMLEVSSRTSAVDLVEAALHGKIRVKVETIGGKPRQWTIERLDAAGQWLTECATGHVSFQWWRKSETYYKINRAWPRATIREPQPSNPTVAPVRVQPIEYAPAY